MDQFVHLRTKAPPKNRQALLTAVLADGINLGLTRMSEACHETTWRQLSWTADWHIREECYVQALAGLIDAQHRQPLAAYWGSGTTSSSDGQFFRAGGRGEVGGLVNLHYGQEPGVKFYTHLSDQFGPYHTKVIAATANEAPHVLDGLLYHQSSLVINEHYTDTGGFSDHVFAMCRLLGFRFAPRIRDLKEKRLYLLPGMTAPPELASMVGGTINLRAVTDQWFELLRLALSVKTGTATASVILRKLAAYPRQNGLALALRERGKLERTLFTLQWLQDPDLRRRSSVGLNKGEQQNALRRAVFFNRLGEIRDRSYENQRHRASGLNLLVAAIILWNTVYLQRAVDHLRSQGYEPTASDLAHLSPLGWEHINLTGDYHWETSPNLGPDQFRPLRAQPKAWPPPLSVLKFPFRVFSSFGRILGAISAHCQSVPRHAMEHFVHFRGVHLHPFVDPPVQQRQQTSGKRVCLGRSPHRIRLHACHLQSLLNRPREDSTSQRHQIVHLA